MVCGGYPLIEHYRRDVTRPLARFRSLPKYPSYLIVCRPETKPLQVVAVLHGKRDMEEILKDLLPESTYFPKPASRTITEGKTPRSSEARAKTRSTVSRPSDAGLRRKLLT